MRLRQRALCALLSCTMGVAVLDCAKSHDRGPLEPEPGSSGQRRTRQDAGDDDDGHSPHLDAATDAANTETADASVDCSDLASDVLPDALACTGLYEDIGEKTIAHGVHEYTPALRLWSDGAQKTRWVHLPEGTKIDASDPTEWRFPVGTKLWKEFVWNGKRAETRLFWKVGDKRWIKTAYRWNDDESAATRFAGGMVQVAGEDYYIPSPKECDQCHKGRTDRALGFEAALLGLDGARGFTLQALIDGGWLEHNELPAELTLGDDGTGMGAAALGWLHVNCGVSCHNGNPASEAHKTDLRFRLSAAQLDGSALTDADARTTAIDVDAKTPRWSGQKIIAPGSPADSLLYELIAHRDARMKDQMPPIATRVVDADGTATIKAWIEALGESNK